MHKTMAVLPGDVIGPEVIHETRKVLDAISSRFSHQFNYVEGDVGAIANDRYGDPLP